VKLKFKAFDEMVDIKNLKKSPFQRNKHPKEQIRVLAKIMKEEGVTHPIHVSNLTGTVCFGHGRLEAAKLNGWTKFPVVFQDFDDEDEEYRKVQSDNGIAMWADLDLALINKDLENLGPFDVELLGIEDFAIEPMDKMPEIPEKKKKKCPHCDGEL